MPYNEIDHTEEDSGYYKVYSNDDPVHKTQHTKQHKAQESADNLVNQGDTNVYYERISRINCVGIGENIGENVGENTGTSGLQNEVPPPGGTPVYGLPTNEIAFWKADDIALGATPGNFIYLDFSGKSQYKTFEQPVTVSHTKMPSGRALRYKLLGKVAGTDISFSGSTISSVTTDLSNYVNGHVITISGSTSNNGNWTVSGTPSATSLTITGAFITESAGAEVVIVGNYTTAGYGGHESQLDALTFMQNQQGIPTSNLYGQKIYMGMFWQITHHPGAGYPLASNNEDIFYTAANSYDFNKFFEWHTSGVVSRILMNVGQIPWCRPDYGNYTNASVNANRFAFSASLLEPASVPPRDWFPPNLLGHSCSNWYELSYDRVYAMVMAMTPHTSAGTFEVWINGTKLCDYSGIQTYTTTSYVIDHMKWLGTINQGDPGDRYNCPLHYIDFDYILLTTDLQDVTDCGYMQDPEA